MRLVVARCEVRYTGRLSAFLPEALRLLMFKSDGSVLVHADSGGYKPLNWMTPPTTIEEEGEPPERIVVRKLRGDEQLEILVSEVVSDSVHEMDELAEIQEADLAEWSALWDPLAFHLSHPQPKITDHEYSEATLKALAVKAVDIRQSIKKKAVLYQQDDEIPLATSQPAAGRQGLKHSTRASNPEGLLEKEIRARQLRDEPAGCRYKKRKRKELSFLEIQEIVHCYLHRHHTQST